MPPIRSFKSQAQKFKEFCQHSGNLNLKPETSNLELHHLMVVSLICYGNIKLWTDFGRKGLKNQGITVSILDNIFFTMLDSLVLFAPPFKGVLSFSRLQN
jgi:hypothetical protein